MAYVTRPSQFQGNIEPTRPAMAGPALAPRGLFRRLYDAFIEGRQRRTQREIDRYVAWRNPEFTDSFDREMSARALRGDWSVRG
jgi:hypothetical protein